MKTFSIWLKIELFRFLREPITLFFTLIFPLLLIFIFGDSFGSEVSSEGFTYNNSLVAIDLTFLIANFTLMGVGNDLANQKETGVEARMELLPISSFFRTVVQSIAYLILLFTSLVLLCIYVFWRYKDVQFRGNILLFLIFMVIGYFFFVNLTKLIISFHLSARALQLISSTVFFVMLFCSGIVIQKESMPTVLQSWVEWSPMYVLYKTLENVWNNTLVQYQYFKCCIYMLLLTAICYAIMTVMRSHRK